MPKFSFPIPGRKTHKSKADQRQQSTYSTRTAHPPSPVVSTSGSSLSKAQRFFGTDNDLNIDSPTRDDDSWMISSSRSSVMSISISESTYSTRTTDDTGSMNGGQNNRWNDEDGIPAFPQVPGLNGRASSTILGVKYAEAGSITNTSARLRSEDSSSTLKSFYDRQNSPLAISQQTSASSSRDLALRKGLPKVVPTSPLLHVESVESLDSMVIGRDGHELNRRSSKRKPAKLDLSMLFPVPGRFVSKSPSASHNDKLSTSSPALSQKTGPRKLTKPVSKESMRSQPATHSSHLPTSRSQQSNSRLQQSQSTHFHSSQHNPQYRIPDSQVPKRRSTMATTHLKPPLSGRSMPNREVRPDSTFMESPSPSDDLLSTLAPPRPWDVSSAASVSSSNTKASKRTNNSNLSKTDLLQQSVLSLSSDSEGDSDLDELPATATSSEDKAARILNGSISSYNEASRPTSQRSTASTSRAYDHRKRNAQLDQFPSIPETTMPSHRISGPWALSAEELAVSHNSLRRSSIRQSRIEPSNKAQHLAVPKASRYSLSQPKDARTPQKHLSRKESLTSQRSFQPTPPLSPSSMEFRVDPEDSNRFMAVTKQEEALLAALRQKRAMMRERNAEEQELGYRSPPRTAEDIKSSFYSDGSSPPQNTRDSSAHSKQTVLMFLESSVADARLYTAEPSPDLSDFLGFDSDDDTTPRTSWITSREGGAPRPDSTISPSSNSKANRLRSGTQTSMARLSAVGVSGGFGASERANEQPERPQQIRKQRSSVRFKADLVGAGEDEEDGMIWGLSHQ